MEGKYIYAIIDSGKDSVLGISGLDSRGQVYTLSYRGVGCVLSHYGGAELASMPKQDVVRCLLAHQVVVEHAMRKHTVLPVRFGTILSSTSEVSELLSLGHSQFVEALAWIGNKIEIEVAATWNTEQVLKEVSLEPEVVRARESIALSGQQTIEERIRLGQTVKASLDRRRDCYRGRMVYLLRSAAVDVQPNALVSDRMVMNVAFLIERPEQEEFERRVGQLNDLFHNQIDFRIIGPLPPYSFASVEVARPGLDRVETARQLLRLGEDPSEREVRRAYRRLAAEAHPDARPGDDSAKAQFASLRQASELLISYCRARAKSDSGLLVKINRSRGEDVPPPQPPPNQRGWGRPCLR